MRPATHIVGITGGIGSGKSYVCQIMQSRFGIPIYDSDAEAKRLNNESPLIRQALTQLVGTHVYDDKGKLQRNILAQYLFANEENASRINAIVHPVVKEDFKNWVLQQSHAGRPIIALESAILFESGFDRVVHHTINVSAPHELCLQWAMQRDNAPRQAIEARMERQMDDQQRQLKAHYTIINDGRDVETQLQRILKDIEENNINK